MSEARILLLCHDGGWDRLHQAASCAATAASTGSTVDVVFYYGALEKLLDGRLDEVTLEPRDPAREQQLMAGIERNDTRMPSELFSAARTLGSMRVLACSASLALLDRDAVEAADKVDAVVGWPTVLTLMEKSSTVLYL